MEHPDDFDHLVDRFGDRKYVLLGEASHGTSEYYRWRSRSTARLIREKEVPFAAVEGDIRLDKVLYSMGTNARLVLGWGSSRSPFPSWYPNE
jgi:hypothetical protein